ncbi:uncharacterized protein LOC112057838 isoform X2 [Bicyclus anynana]|uniref:Uncharacterized protein LOC112057838 isoform X2 n=1 Tax=Bicyclus anynana TaxID=110368 RepID=A0A6J1P8Z9_BICAN|nr:uncharacterized protein LOC112057838 isoform X2 [Bicyclus anynana]
MGSFCHDFFSLCNVLHNIVVIGSCFGKISSCLCYGGKCMHCIEVETGSLIFAIISMLLNSAGILFMVGMLVYVNILLTPEAHAKLDAMSEGDYTTNAALFVILCFLLVPFVFTIVLIRGLVQKKAIYVKVYFIYSMILKCLGIFGVVTAIAYGAYTLGTALIAVAVCVFFAFILRMIYLTYKKFEMGAQYDRTKLVELQY